MDRLGDLEDDIHVMLDEQHGDMLPFPQAVHLVDHAPAFIRAHAGGRLIQQQHFRIHRQGQADIQQLLVTMRQDAGRRISHGRQPQQIQNLADPPLYRCEREAGQHLPRIAGGGT